MSAATGAIIGNCAVSFYDQVDRQDREDIFDSLLHAQWFADQHFDPRVDYSSWLFRYRARLESRGWQLLAPIKHVPEVIFKAADLEEATFSIIDTAGSAGLAELARASWLSMEGNRYAEHFFSTGSNNGELARYQMVPCMRDSNGCTQMLVCAIQLTGAVETRDFDFWNETQREMVLRIKGGVYRFDRSVYASYRDAIRERLQAGSDYAIRQYPI